MYEHGISTLMLAEAAEKLEGAGEQRVRGALDKAVKLILRAQNVEKAGQHRGGWRYLPTSRDSDLSVTSWQVLALRAAKDAKCDIPEDNVRKAIDYVKRCAVDGGGFTYQPGLTTATATRSSFGIVCLEVLGEHHTPESLAAAEFILQNPLRERPQGQWFFDGSFHCAVSATWLGGDDAEKIRVHVYQELFQS